MKKNYLFKLAVVLAGLSVLFSNTTTFAQTLTPPGVEQLQQATGGEIEFTWNPATGTPSFIRGQIPAASLNLSDQVSSSTTATTFLDIYAGLFGIEDTTKELLLIQEDLDNMDIKHITFSQVYQGIEVYNAGVKIHLLADSQEILAMSNSFVPNINLTSVNPQISSEQALSTAQKALPDGILTANPQLVVYPGFGPPPDDSAKLVWLIELRDDSIPVRNVYVVDAIEGGILDVISRLYFGRDIKTYDAEHSYSLPGTLRRSEGSGSTGDQDVDNAHDFAGATYDYYWNTHSRDSYDGQGASIISTAHYGTNYQNAFWNGEQMVYGDSFPVNDVVAHELTHAVTEHSANLEYRWQSGALNESFSDIFGAMVDRDDWLMGEDLPPEALGGREAIRDLADPTNFGQPDHTDDWVETCSDNEGVHTNSGITNKAYYNIATTISKEKAELIFYRALTVYLQPTSSLEDARAATLQSAQDTFGSGSAEYNAVVNGFNAVGLDGNWNPPENDCTCAASLALSDSSVDMLSGLETIATLYRVRDQLMTSNVAGEHYRDLYEQYTVRISYLLLLNSSLKGEGASILLDVTPGLSQLSIGQDSESIVTKETVNNVITFVERLATEDRSNGGGELAQTIESEMSRIDWEHLIGISYGNAWEYFQAQFGVHSIYLPIVVR